MADSNEDILEDGDLTEANFEELDLAQEDALLADDLDECPDKSNDNGGEKTTPDDDDYLDLDNMEDMDDEYLTEDEYVSDDDVVENGNVKKRKPIEFSSHENDNSDEKSRGERSKFKSYSDNGDEQSRGERSRFKSERHIISRSSSKIPETLDAVAIRTPLKFNNRGGFRGKGRGGNFNRKFHRNHPRNIHVNPRFRPRGPGPMGGPGMWNRRYHHRPPHPLHFQQPYPQPYGYQPPMQPYYGGGQDEYYPAVQPPYVPQPPPPQPQMGWGDADYYPGGPPPNYPPPAFQPQMLPPRMRPPFNMGPTPFDSNFNVQHNVDEWSNPIGSEDDQFRHQGIAAPIKKKKYDFSAFKPPSNLEEVKIVDCVPPDALTPEEDEEMKAYRKKIEEQKKLREQLLKQKEENRMVAAQQKLQESGASSTIAKVNSVVPTTTIAKAPAVPQEDRKSEMKVVRVRTADGKIVLKKMTNEQIKKLKKLPSNIEQIKTMKKLPPSQQAQPASIDTPSCVVAVENLSASTTQKQLEDMASQIGPIQKVELDIEKKTAIIRFTQLDTAKAFVGKYQRKMVDLSMIGLRFIKE